MFTKDPILNSVAEAYKKMSKDMMVFHDEAYGKVYTVKKEDANEFITKAAAAKKAGQTSFKLGDKTYPVTIKIDPDKILEAEKAMKDASSKKAKVTVNPTDDDLRENSGESVVNEEVRKKNKIQTQKGTLELNSAEDSEGLIIDVIFNKVMLSTIYIDFLTGKVEVQQRYKKVKLKESLNEASDELKKLEDAIKVFQDKINKQGIITNARDEDHLENLIKIYKQMGGKRVKESVVNEMNDMEMVADQLVNNVEDGMMSKNEFADLLSQETKFDKKSLGKIYDEYLDLDPRTRMKMLKTRDMMKFLKDQGLKEEVVNEGEFKKDDLVYNKKTKRVGIVRTPDNIFDVVELDVDGVVDVKHLEKFNHDKHSGKAKVEKSTEKEINKRGLYQPFKPKNESVVNEQSSNRDVMAISRMTGVPDYKIEAFLKRHRLKDLKKVKKLIKGMGIKKDEKFAKMVDGNFSLEAEFKRMYKELD